jgi:hypothetical protein
MWFKLMGEVHNIVASFVEGIQSTQLVRRRRQGRARVAAAGRREDHETGVTSTR